MSPETPPPHLVDAIKASAVKLKEKQTALEARARELDALKARLDQERADLDAKAAKIAADRKALDQERQGLDDVRASMERDLGAINDARDGVARDKETLERDTKALEGREKTLKGDEERVARLAQEVTGQMRDTGSNLRGLLERGETFVKLQADWLAAVEVREKELRTISEELRSRQTEFVQQHDALVALKGSLEHELNKMLAEHETLTNKEKSILEAEKYLASALQIEGLAVEAPAEPPAPPVAPEPPAPAPPPAPEPAASAEPEPQPEPAPVQVSVTVQEEPAPEPEVKPRPTKGEATERLARAVEAWKRARDSGWKVTDIRRTVKLARDAIENGDFDRAILLAAEIIEQLQAATAAR
jgi:uncharacterized protein YukE